MEAKESSFDETDLLRLYAALNHQLSTTVPRFPAEFKALVELQSRIGRMIDAQLVQSRV
jgi:hypothetical protein